MNDYDDKGRYVCSVPGCPAPQCVERRKEQAFDEYVAVDDFKHKGWNFPQAGTGYETFGFPVDTEYFEALPPNELFRLDPVSVTFGRWPNPTLNFTTDPRDKSVAVFAQGGFEGTFGFDEFFALIDLLEANVNA